MNEEQGRMKLLVNGSPQSGKYIKWLWKRAFDHFGVFDSRNWGIFHSGNRHLKNALVLGIGGGTVISLLSDYFSGIKLTCVDIDETIISIARKYFHIDVLPHTRMIHADALEYVRKQRGKHRYDCIIIDLFFGRNIPSFVAQKKFLQTLKRLLNNNGWICINYLREEEYREKSDKLDGILHDVFPFVSDYEIARNRFFFASI